MSLLLSLSKFISGSPFACRSQKSNGNATSCPSLGGGVASGGSPDPWLSASVAGQTQTTVSAISGQRFAAPCSVAAASARGCGKGGVCGCARSSDQSEVYSYKRCATPQRDADAAPPTSRRTCTWPRPSQPGSSSTDAHHFPGCANLALRRDNPEVWMDEALGWWEV